MNRIWGISILAGSALLGACASGDTTAEESGGPSSVTGEVKEWEVVVDKDSVPAGEVTFTITNNGTIEHEFLVVKTDLAVGEIPVEGDHFSENLESISVIDEIGEWAAGTTEALRPGGNHVMFVFMPGKLLAGDEVSFRLRLADGRVVKVTAPVKATNAGSESYKPQSSM